MKQGRLLAFLIILLPAVCAISGVKFMRDALFSMFDQQGFQWGLMILGLCLFLVGVAFVGGFIRYRDKKRNYRPKFKDDLD